MEYIGEVGRINLCSQLAIMEEEFGKGVKIFCPIQDNIGVKFEDLGMERTCSETLVHPDIYFNISSSELYLQEFHHAEHSIQLIDNMEPAAGTPGKFYTPGH